GALIRDACRRAAEKSIDQTVFDIDEASSSHAEDPDADDAAVEALKIDVADVHGPPDVRCGKGIEGDVDGVRSGDEDRAEYLVAIDSDRLGDGDRAEAAGIDAVDLPVHSRLRNGAREGLAWRRPAARIGVIADTGYPGSTGLRAGGARSQRQGEDRSGKRKRHGKRIPHGRLRYLKVFNHSERSPRGAPQQHPRKESRQLESARP